MKWTFPDNLIAGFIRYDLCKTCKTDNNHQRDSCINCRNKREAPEILRDFCRTMMTIVNELLGLSKAYKFPFGAVRNAFYWHFCQRQKAEITHAFNLITHRPSWLPYSADSLWLGFVSWVGGETLLKGVVKCLEPPCSREKTSGVDFFAKYTWFAHIN